MSNHISANIGLKDSTFDSYAKDFGDAQVRIADSESKLRNAIASGNLGEISLAQMENQKEMMIFNALSTMLKNKMDTMMQIIRNMKLN